MSLEQKISDQYRARLNTESLYNSEYSRQADKERYRKMRGIVSHFNTGGSVLEIGAGQGDNVPLLEYCGFTDISLNELLPDRVAMARAKYKNAKIIPGNALTIGFTEMYDCVFQSTVFTSILSDEDRKALATKMWALVKPGGIILWYDFIYNNPSNSNVRKVSVKETVSLFPLATRSRIQHVTLAPPVGRRVGKLYPLFNVPILRSHILAVFQKG